MTEIDTMKATASLRRLLTLLALTQVLSGCAFGGVNLGLSLPIGRNAGVGVNVGSDGRIGTSVGVGVGGGSVSVGTSAKLPPAAKAADEAAGAKDH